MKRFDIPGFDFSVIGLTALLCSAGALIIFSATSGDTQNASDPYFYLKKQLLFMLAGIALMIVCALIDFNKLTTMVVPIYLLNLALLGLVLFLGKSTGGASRWFSIGIFKLQPSEFAKIFMIIVMAAILSTKKGEYLSPNKIFFCIAGLVPPMILTLTQPDLGTSLVLIAVFVGMLFCSGADFRVLSILVLIGLLAVVVAVKVPLLKPYQIDRLSVFMNPEDDPRGAGYNLIQSKIAIGSGSVSGKGLFSGSQTALGFVPEHHTDFIFTVLGERMGFIGASVVLALYLLLLLRTISIALAARNSFGMLIAVGVVSMLTFQIFVNIGMTIGIMPITGIPLPFISYGGSSLLTTFMAMGLILNVSNRGFTIGDIR